MGVDGQMSCAAVFLDRDGVINRALVRDGTPHAPLCEAQLRILQGVPAALAALRSHGFPLIVVTNQPDVARNIVTRETVEGLHARLRRELPLDAILTCFHDSADACECRKPKPGLLLQAARELNVDLGASFMIGDRAKDVEAGRRAGCRTFFVDHGYAEAPPPDYDFRVLSLAEAADIILAQAWAQ
jgi:D-glycero-D-manno-heptose 1,7-bisphosphate phosphatase